MCLKRLSEGEKIMNIDYKNISPELIKIAQESLKGDKSINQSEYDNLVKTALRDKNLNRDEQLFLASLDNESVISKLLSSDFNPKSFTFSVNKTEAYNPTLLITRTNNGNKELENINVRTISKDQSLEQNIIKGRDVCEYVSSHLAATNKFENISDASMSVFAFMPNIIARGRRLVTGTDINLDSPSKNVKNVGDNYSEVSKIARIAKSHATGNCGENAALSAIMLAEYGVSPVETFTIPGHTFTVVGRDHSSNPSDPSTWGATAVIVDPWNKFVSPVSDIVDKLKELKIEKMYDVAK